MLCFDDLIRLERNTETTHRGPLGPDRASRMFGGLFIAQSMAAAQASIENDRHIHSLHCYFLRPGDTSLPVEYEVDLLRDGRNFSHREVNAYQNDKILFRMICSYAVQVDSLWYEPSTMPIVPPPKEVTYTYSDFCRDQMPNPDYLRDVAERQFDIRYVNPPQDFECSSEVESQKMWMRMTCNISQNSHAHDAAVAYLSDSTLIDHITIPHGKRWQDDNFDGTSLDHAMWFHRRADATQWLLFDQNVEWTGDGRGLATGRFYTEDGQLIATCSQEGLMRFKPQP